jgi:lysophospholipase L1-like esterase
LDRALAALALLLGGTVVGFLVAEAIVRVALPPPETVSIERARGLESRLAEENRDRKEVAAASQFDLAGLFVETPTGLRMRAGTVARIHDPAGADGVIVIRTNSLGYRNPEIGPKTRTRVLFLGDSITVSQYLREEASFVRRVQVLSEAAGEPIETINAAVAGIGLENEIAILRETGLRTEPDVVVLGFFLNDVEPSPGVRVLQPPRFLQWSWFARHLGRKIPFLLRPETFRLRSWETGPWRRELRSLYPPGDGDPESEPAAFNATILGAYQDWGSAWTASAWRRLEPLLMEFRRLADENGFTPLIICFPVSLQVRARFEYDQPQRRLRAIAERLDVPVLDLLPVLREAAPRAPAKILRDHCHYSEYGNEFLAPIILDFIRAHRPGAGDGPPERRRTGPAAPRAP